MSRPEPPGDREDERGEVLIDVAVADLLRDQVASHTRDRHDDTQLVRRLKAQVEVLLQQHVGERRREVQVHERRRLVLREHRTHDRVVEERQEVRTLHASLLGQHRDLRHRLDDDAEEHVVRDLHDACDLALTDVGDAAAPGRKQRLGDVVDLTRTGGGDGELARPRSPSGCRRPAWPGSRSRATRRRRAPSRSPRPTPWTRRR